ncbi:hypothetical protein FOPE_10473 [Fonsecaea pedrosoi]|nr:hypothetical protein FOPE_10473 [Fonsecaea pedrosoi]
MQQLGDPDSVCTDSATPRTLSTTDDDPGESLKPEQDDDPTSDIAPNVSPAELEPNSEADQLPPPAKQTGTLYAVHIFDSISGQKSFYRPTPLGGIDFKLSESSPSKEDDNKDALIQFGVYVETDALEEKKGNTAQDWWLNPADFDFGTKVKANTVYGHYLELKSQNLIKALESIVDYDPELFSRGLSRHQIQTQNSGRFETLLLYCYDLKAQWEKYLETRCQPAIRYPKLTAEARHQIWLKFYEMYERSTTRRIKITNEAKLRLRKDDTDLNGREIRNIMQTAVRFACLDDVHDPLNAGNNNTSDGVTETSGQSSDLCVPPKVLWVDWDHISKALERHKAFQNYVAGINRGMSEEKRNALSGNY